MTFLANTRENCAKDCRERYHAAASTTATAAIATKGRDVTAALFRYLGAGLLGKAQSFAATQLGAWSREILNRLLDLANSALENGSRSM